MYSLKITFLNYTSEETQKGTATTAFIVPEQFGGDTETLNSALQFIYKGQHLVDYAAVLANGLPALIACADYLQIECLADACKHILNDRCARKDVC